MKLTINCKKDDLPENIARAQISLANGNSHGTFANNKGEITGQWDLSEDGQPSNTSVEKEIIIRMFAHVKKAGFVIESVWDGDESTEKPTEEKALELISDLDEAHVYFKKDGFLSHYVYLVGGNGRDVVSDYSFSEHDEDNFEAAMQEFIDILIAEED